MLKYVNFDITKFGKRHIEIRKRRLPSTEELNPLFIIDTLLENTKDKEGADMSIAELIGLLSLLIGTFQLGYQAGKNSKKKLSFTPNEDSYFYNITFSIEQPDSPYRLFQLILYVFANILSRRHKYFPMQEF